MRGDSDVASRVSATWRPINFESMVAQSRYDKGKLVEIRLYPTSGAWDGPVSQLGLPRMAPPALAQKILARVQALSKPFGTDDRDREQRRHHPDRPEPDDGVGGTIA